MGRYMEEAKNSEASRSFLCGCQCGRETKVIAVPVVGGLLCYECEHCNRRNVARMLEGRKQKAAVQKLDDAIIQLLAEIDYAIGPRAVAYQLVNRGVIDKKESDFDKVGHRLIVLRRHGRAPYGWLADNSRSIAHVARHENIEDALREWQADYRRDMWQLKDFAAEVWIEKAGMIPVISDVTVRYGVPVYIAKGFSGISFLHGAAQSIRKRGKHTFIAHLGDHDKAGWDAARAIERDLRGFGADVSFVRLSVTEQQINDWQLQTRPPKARDKGFDECVELDAVPAELLRRELTSWLSTFISESELNANKVAEQSERDHFTRWLAVSK